MSGEVYLLNKYIEEGVEPTTRAFSTLEKVEEVVFNEYWLKEKEYILNSKSIEDVWRSDVMYNHHEAWRKEIKNLEKYNSCCMNFLWDGFIEIRKIKIEK